MDADMDTFVTALYVKIDDELAMNSSLRIARPAVGQAVGQRPGSSNRGRYCPRTVIFRGGYLLFPSGAGLADGGVAGA